MLKTWLLGKAIYTLCTFDVRHIQIHIHDKNVYSHLCCI